jgi:tRNA(adenine34) deaminase
MDDVFFMRKALAQAELALAAGEFPVGCILVAESTVLASGSRSGTSGERPNEVDHAEMLALRRFSRLEKAVDPASVSAYATMEPCLMCYGALILSGIGRVVWAYEDVMGGGTGCDLSALPALYRSSAIEVVPGVLRDRSLALFKRFFSAPQNDYWRGSLLAEYTLGADARGLGCRTA